MNSPKSGTPPNGEQARLRRPGCAAQDPRNEGAAAPEGRGREGATAAEGGEGPAATNASVEAVPRAVPLTGKASSSSGGGGGGVGRGDGGERKDEANVAAEEEPTPSLGVRAALSMLAFYRNVLSPLMPSTCRFLPTCSVYSIESYKKFGVARGTVLTAWRLLRCNPWGGRGYDPPAWPPVGLGAIYQYPYTPEVTVVLGAVLAYWFVASTIESLVY